MTLEIPDLVTFRLHKSIPDIDVDGVPVPGLRGEFYRRERGGRTESVGVYSYRHRVFIAWGTSASRTAGTTPYAGPTAAGSGPVPDVPRYGCCAPLPGRG